MRLIQVGLGGWGLDWARSILPTVPAAEVIAAVDADPAALARAQEQLALPPAILFGSLDEALAAVAADAVLITLPTAAHCPVAIAALRAGKHVLVEKPFAPRLADAAEVVAVAAALGRVLMVSQNYRYFPAVATAARLLRQGALGRPVSASIVFRKNWQVTGHRYHAIPGPLLLDMAIHHFDLVRMLFGEVARLSCRSWTTTDSPFLEHAAAEAILELQDGMIVGYHGSWLSRGLPTTWTGDWTVECERGVLVFSGRGRSGAAEDRLVLHTPEGTSRRVRLRKLRHIDRAGALAAFIAAVETGRAPPDFTDGADNLRSLALCFAAMRSAAEAGAWTAPDPAGSG